MWALVAQVQLWIRSGTCLPAPDLRIVRRRTFLCARAVLGWHTLQQ